MKRLCLVPILCLAALAATAQPVVTGALNAAGYMRPGLPNGGLAQGSFIAIFGRNLAPQGTNLANYPLPAAFQGVSARIGSAELFIVYTTPNQVGAIVPSITPLGDLPLTLTFNGQTSAPLTVRIVSRSLGLFTLNQAGSGPVVGLKFISQTSQPPSTLVEAMNPGGTVTLFGTGLGASSNPDNLLATNTSVTGITPADVEVLIGGRRAPVRFAGRSTCCAAIDQIVADIPADVTPGCYVGVQVRVGGVTSNTTTISVAPAGQRICSDPNGYTAAQLEQAQRNGSFTTGFIGLAKSQVQQSAQGFPLNQIFDNLTGSFERRTFQNLLFATGQSTFISIGSCTVFSFEGEDAVAVDPIPVEGRDAGPRLTATAGGRTETLEKPSPGPFRGVYSRLISPGLGIPIPGIPSGGTEFLTTGEHRVAGPGGPDIGAFTASINWPAAFVWSNRDAISIVNRATNLDVAWTGGDPQGFVSINGFSAAPLGSQRIGAGFVCLSPASAGRFTVPAAVLQSLPITGTASTEDVPFGQLVVAGVSRTGSFTATGLDAGYISYESSVIKSVRYQ